MTTHTHHDTDRDTVGVAAQAQALRSAHGDLANLAAIAWPHDPIPEILARVEALTALLPLVPASSPAAAHILTTMRADGRVLSEVDGYGLLRGPIRARYLAAITALTR